MEPDYLFSKLVGLILPAAPPSLGPFASTPGVSPVGRYWQKRSPPGPGEPYAFGLRGAWLPDRRRPRDRVPRLARSLAVTGSICPGA